MEDLFSKWLSVLLVSSQVLFAMVLAVGLAYLGPGLWYRLNGRGQVCEAGRVEGTKANTYRRCISESSVFAVWGIACERACICGCVMGRLCHGRKRVVCHQATILCSGLTISDYSVILNLKNLWKVTLNELLPLCLITSKPVDS